MAEPDIGPEIWTRTHLFPFLDGKYDGQTERIYIVRTQLFTPAPMHSWEQLNAEHVTDIAWWTVDELHSHDGIFTPRRLPQLVSQVIVDGPPSTPVDVGV